MHVYDIDEVDGQTFLSMEYVDGEDVASLLRRVGRFSEDRGLEIARQICAGLAAAHERDVVHRDLKPANVMLDGTGKVRITDFGLAGMAGEALRAGTPAYMAPEQLAGNEVTARSDIYSLGLVLYEIFTGQRALEGKNLAELIQKREQSVIQAPTTIVKTLDPKIEIAIMRCLRPEPEARPKSALAVAAALPGGDPLAAALAAGETPSPEMVAAAGTSEALHPAIGLSLLALVLAGLIALGALCDRALLYSYVPIQKPLAVLEDKAREITASLGYRDPVVDSARGLSIDNDYLRYISSTDKTQNRWERLRRRDLPVVRLWYRASPALLVPLPGQWFPTLTNPPTTEPGMTTTIVDDTGRLVDFLAVLPRTETTTSDKPAPPWPALFAAAGLNLSSFQPKEPEWLPRVFADARAAWEGPVRDGSDLRVRVEAASYRGRPVFFRFVVPGTAKDSGPQSPATNSSTFWKIAASVLSVTLLLGALALARHNLREGRGDRRGAARTSLFMLLVYLAAWIISGSHFLSLDTERNHLFAFLAYALLNAGILWLIYIAVEPYVRRFAPALLISWSRVTGGTLRDPQVGRDLLVGAAVGVAVALIAQTFQFVPSLLLGEPPGTPRATNTLFLLEPRVVVGAVLRMIPNGLSNAMSFAVVFMIGRAVSGRTWVAALFTMVILGVFVMGEGSSEHRWLMLLFSATFAIPMVLTLVYGGMLAAATAFLVNQVLQNAPLTIDVTQPHAGGMTIAVLFVGGLAAFGYYASRDGQPLFGRLLRTD